jgi:hypothetical protein
MLTREMMGLLALAVLWLNAALTLAVALKQLATLRALARHFRAAKARGELVTGIATSRDGGPFAVRRIRQLGRAMTTKGPDRILFTDGAQSFEVRGGTLEADGAVLEVAQAPAAASEVWIDAQRAREGTACRGAAAFDQAWPEASTFKGHAREVELEVRTGDRVWVLGARENDRLVARADGPLLVSMVDPIAFVTKKAWLVVLFLVGASVSLAGVTALALWPPHFGVVSTIGGALGFVYFVGVTPIATAVRDAIKTPAQALVGALWQRPQA